MQEFGAALQRPSAAYAAGVSAGQWQDDLAQRSALVALDRLHNDLLAKRSRLSSWLRGGARPVRGLYLWGEVGRGKTFLIDLFYQHLPLRAKRRLHFHRFMEEVHAQLKALGQRSDPLVEVAAVWAGESRLLCLDEFFVQDIGDAMILARLLEALFARDVVLVTTSNTAPANLYRDGLQRARFLPAIALIEKHCEVRHLTGPVDHRLRALQRAPMYYTPLDEDSEAQLAVCYTRLTQQDIEACRPLSINGRSIAPIACADGVAWFAFELLCDGPRSSADYLEIAREFHTVLLSGVPAFDHRSDDAARRFVHLIDTLYDRNVKLLASAAAPPHELYRGERLAFEFRRTASRLVEMQSEDYLARSHLP